MRKIFNVSRPEDRGGQAGKNGDGMDEALVEHAQHHVNHQNGHDQQNREALEGLLEGLHGSLVKRGQRRGHAQLANQIVDTGGRIAQREAGHKIERDQWRRAIGRSGLR